MAGCGIGRNRDVRERPALSTETRLPRHQTGRGATRRGTAGGPRASTVLTIEQTRLVPPAGLGWYDAMMQLATSPDLSPFTEAGFRALARRALEPPQCARAQLGAAAGPSDFDLNPELAAEAGPGGGLPAAVLVPVVARPELTLLLTLRTGQLSAHAGQIAFPGGKVEAFDAGPLAAALREAEEEIGLKPALVEPSISLALNTREVVEAFEVPLSFLMDARNHQVHARAIGGSERRFYAMPYGERFIWGATAGILRNMHQRLFRS